VIEFALHDREDSLPGTRAGTAGIGEALAEAPAPGADG